MKAELGPAQSERSACSNCYEALSLSLVFCAHTQAHRVRVCFPLGVLPPSKCLVLSKYLQASGIRIRDPVPALPGTKKP